MHHYPVVFLLCPHALCICFVAAAARVVKRLPITTGRISARALLLLLQLLETVAKEGGKQNCHAHAFMYCSTDSPRSPVYCSLLTL